MRVVSWGLVQKGWVCFLTLHDCICVTWGSPFYGLYLIYFPFLIQWCTTLLFFHQGPCPNFITSRSNEITKRSSSKVPQSQKEGNKERSEKRKYQLKILERHRLEGGTATLSEAHLRLKNKTTSNSVTPKAYPGGGKVQPEPTEEKPIPCLWEGLPLDGRTKLCSSRPQRLSPVPFCLQVCADLPNML